MNKQGDKRLKLFYSISEGAQQFGVNESLLRYWEKEFPDLITPKKAGGNILNIFLTILTNISSSLLWRNQIGEFLLPVAK